MFLSDEELMLEMLDFTFQNSISANSMVKQLNRNVAIG